MSEVGYKMDGLIDYWFWNYLVPSHVFYYRKNSKITQLNGDIKLNRNSNVYDTSLVHYFGRSLKLALLKVLIFLGTICTCIINLTFAVNDNPMIQLVPIMGIRSVSKGHLKAVWWLFWTNVISESTWRCEWRKELYKSRKTLTLD